MSNRSVKRDFLAVADTPIVRTLSCIRYGFDNVPFGVIELRTHESKRQRVGGRGGNDIDGAARRLPVLCRRDRVRPRLRDGENRVPLLVFVAIVVPPFFSVTDAPESTLTVIVAEKNVSATA